MPKTTTTVKHNKKGGVTTVITTSYSAKESEEAGLTEIFDHIFANPKSSDSLRKITDVAEKSADDMWEPVSLTQKSGKSKTTKKNSTKAKEDIKNE